MLEFTRSHVDVLPRIPVQVWLSAGTLGSFAWLLLQDKIHPAVVFLLQTYLTF